MSLTPKALSDLEHGTTPFTSWGDVLMFTEVYQCEHHELLEAMHRAGDDE
jgi:hypothetical protein